MTRGVCIQGGFDGPPPALWDTVNKWVVCTLLECILVYGICNPISGLSLALIQKLVKISVGKWLLETTRPHKDVKTFGKYSSLFTHFKYFLAIVVSFESCILIDNLSEASLFHNCGQVDFPVDKLIPKVTRPLYECLKILNKWPVSMCWKLIRLPLFGWSSRSDVHARSE